MRLLGRASDVPDTELRSRTAALWDEIETRKVLIRQQYDREKAAAQHRD